MLTYYLGIESFVDEQGNEVTPGKSIRVLRAERRITDVEFNSMPPSDAKERLIWELASLHKAIEKERQKLANPPTT